MSFAVGPLPHFIVARLVFCFAGNDSVTADPLSELARIQSGGNASSLNWLLDLAILPIARIVWSGAYVFMNHVVRSAHKQQAKEKRS